MIKLQDVKNWEDMKNHVVWGDCLEGMKLIPDKSIDLILTDPPYSVGFDYGNNSDKQNVENYLRWMDEILKECNRIMRENSNLLIFFGEKYLPQKIQLLNSIFQYEWIIVWYKPNAMQFGKTGYSKFNLIYWFSKNGSTIKEKMIDVIIDNMGQVENKINHPSPKNINVIRKLINCYSESGDVICDPFMGSWTTARACKDLGRDFIGFELEEDYCKIGEERLRQQNLF